MKPGFTGTGDGMLEQQAKEMTDFAKEVEAIVARDSRYDREAYIFVQEALEHTQRMLKKNLGGAPAHVTGQQLLEGIREHALQRFGPLTLLVFEEWGIRCCEDFGEIVFNLVDQGLLAKTETDSKEDFRGGYDFIDAFRRPFRPRFPGPVSSRPSCHERPD